MINALLLIFVPNHTCERIARARHGAFFVLFIYLAPTIAFSIAVELVGHNYLVPHFADQGAKTIPQNIAIHYGAIEFGAGLVVALLVARCIKLLSETFHNRHGFAQCLVVTGYALGPFYLFHMVDAVPVLSPWISLGVGVFFSFATLYHAIPLVLKPDPPHALGLFLMSGILLTMVSIIARVLTLLALPGKPHFH
jgi:hypothetical protein